ncbi:MAG: ArsR family transcriptional regulator, partial [Rhodospirillaceae bacterium]|nr:ArsR family transcriptional regulator [Rhodospirillaceae bacterium]
MPPTKFPTGVTIYNPVKAHNSYVLFDGRDGRAHLIDMQGNSVHHWPYSGWPVEMIDPAGADDRKGHVL